MLGVIFGQGDDSHGSAYEMQIRIVWKKRRKGSSRTNPKIRDEAKILALQLERALQDTAWWKLTLQFSLN